MWPFVDELFREDLSAAAAGNAAVDPRTLKAAFDAAVPRLIVEAGLEVPSVPAARGGGRAGVHAEAFGPMLAELQVLARAHPGATW
jgi:ring-1,2-phenylacetyl-CoA epoxidase subunit PaaC